MKINNMHPIARHGLVVGQEVTHNGITYDVLGEEFGTYEIEPRRLTVWKKSKFKE